jgi:hypothetical protein
MLTRNCGFSEDGKRLNPITGKRLKEIKNIVPARTSVATGFFNAFSRSGA